ncbi:MAG: hypothetical protein ACI93P_001274 [bacterium]|jgi:hypothetical protein
MKKTITILSVLVSLISFSQAPTIQWQNSVGGTNENFLDKVYNTSDGGYIPIGSSLSNNGDLTGNLGDYDFWIVKVNSLGVIQWQKNIGGTDYDLGRDIKQTPDGDIYL